MTGGRLRRVRRLLQGSSQCSKRFLFKGRCFQETRGRGLHTRLSARPAPVLLALEFRLGNGVGSFAAVELNNSQ